MPLPAATLHIPQPCAVSWEAMTPTPGGRHCTACQKVVVDFTEKTDAELLAHFRQATGANTCGRLRAGQLGRPLQPAVTTNRWRSWLASALALGGALGSGRAVAQGSANFHPGPVPATSPAPGSQAALPEPVPAQRPALPPPAAADGPLLVRGVVTDAATGQGLPGVTVLLKGTLRGTSTDVDGAFTLPISSEETSCTLAISFIGYAGTELPASASAPLAVQLTEAAQMMTGDIVILYSRVPPAPWHPRALYRWGQYWFTRPFRR